MTSRTEFAVGQVWVTASGLSYTIEAQEPTGWRVSIHRHAGKNIGAVTASAKPWYFTDDQLAHQAKTKDFHLYNEKAVAKLDDLAARLEQSGKSVLATALDEIGQDYAEAMRPGKTKRLRVKRSERQLNTLQKNLEDADDPTVVKELTDKIIKESKILENDGPRVKPANPISPPATITEPLKADDPKFVSKA